MDDDRERSAIFLDIMIEYRGYWSGATQENRLMEHQVTVCLSLCAKAQPQEAICGRVVKRKVIHGPLSQFSKRTT